MRKHFILIGILIGTLLLILSSIYYPGGNFQNLDSNGYDWAKNYISNLLSPIAVNGEMNPSRPYAIIGVLFLSCSFGLFFIRFSNKIRVKSARIVIKYLGILATIFGLVTVIPSMHDVMVTLSSILTLLIFFYISVMVFKSKLLLLKILSAIFLMTFYFGAFMYFSRFQIEFMPIMQKIIFLVKVAWVLSLEYFTDRKDFEHIEK